MKTESENEIASKQNLQSHLYIYTERTANKILKTRLPVDYSQVETVRFCSSDNLIYLPYTERFLTPNSPT